MIPQFFLAQVATKASLVEWYKISNNMMDYNQYAPHAVTECQIALMNADLAIPGNRFVHSCNGCMPSIAFFQLPDVYYLCPSSSPIGALYLNGTASFNENRWLIDICEVDPANPNVCLGNNINTGWNIGEIGKVNLSSFYTFQVNKHYRVKLIVDNSDCPPSSEFSKVVETKDCIEPEPNEPFVRFAAINPFSEHLVVFYTVSTPGTLQIRLVNVNTGAISTLLSETAVEPGEYQFSQESEAIASGTYSLQLIFNNHLYAKTIVKP